MNKKLRDYLGLLERLIVTFEEEMDRVQIDESGLNIKQLFLLRKFGPVHYYAQNILMACMLKRSLSAAPALRSMVEAFIVSRYALGSSSEKRIGIIQLDDLYRSRADAINLRDFFEKNRKPNEKSMRDDFKRKIKSIDLTIKALQKAYSFDFKSRNDFQKRGLNGRPRLTVREMAEKADRRLKKRKGETMWLYHVVYGYLSSVDHLDLKGQKAFREAKNKLVLVHAGNEDEAIRLANGVVTVYIHFLKLIKERKILPLKRLAELGREYNNLTRAS